MFPPIRIFLEDYRELNEFLISHGEISLSSDVNHHFRKIYLLSCASFYEKEITEMVKHFIGKNSTDERVLAFTTNKAIERQYHTYFDWKQTKNINCFLGLFGLDFKNSVSTNIKNNDDLAAQVEAFLIIGGERNKMVHENFLEYTLDKTFEELVAYDKKASAFIEFLKTKFE